MGCLTCLCCSKFTPNKVHHVKHDKSVKLNLVVTGCCAVGKTSILRRYVDNNYKEPSFGTFCLDYMITNETIDGKVIKSLELIINMLMLLY